MIPTTPWEVPFKAISRWLGIESSRDIKEVYSSICNFDSMNLTEPKSIISNSLTLSALV